MDFVEIKTFFKDTSIEITDKQNVYTVHSTRANINNVIKELISKGLKAEILSWHPYIYRDKYLNEKLCKFEFLEYTVIDDTVDLLKTFEVYIG